MTIEERNIKLKYYITCLKCQVSGKYCDDNCDTQYAAGHMGEIIKNLEAISGILDQEPKIGNWIVTTDCEGKTRRCICNKCGYETGIYTWKNPNYCSNCGTKMIEPQESEVHNETN